MRPSGERFSWYSSDDLREKIDPPSCRQYTRRIFLAIRPPYWDEIIDGVEDNDNWADPEWPITGMTLPSHGNEIDDGEGQEDWQGGENGTAIRQGTKDGKTKWKWKGMGNGKGKGIIQQISGGDAISRAIALQLQKESSAKLKIDYRLRYAHSRTRAAHSKLPVDPCATRSL